MKEKNLNPSTSKNPLTQKKTQLIEKAMKENQNVEGTIFDRVKGGFAVHINGVVAFLPGSQLHIRQIKDTNSLMNLTQPFKILKIDKPQSNIVVSRRLILEESRAHARTEMLSNISEGDVLEGVVKNITDYGAFIDLGSIDGLLHVTDISWDRINHPSEVVSIGQSIKVQVIKITEFKDGSKRISLGVKQLQNNPWKGIDQKYPRTTKIKGKISNVTDYGAFVEIEKGIEGLVHISEVSWAKNNIHPKKIFSVGQEVECVILDIDVEKHRISLGIKQCEDNPWMMFAVNHPAGSKVKGIIRNKVDFGFFLGFEKGIDGLVHLNDIAWDEKDAADILKNLKEATEIEAVVLLVDVEKERISLGLKQLQGDPLETFSETNKKGDVISCLITSIDSEGIEVKINDQLSSYIRKSELSTDKNERDTSKFKVGDSIDAKIINVDRKIRKVLLSVRAFEVDEQQKVIAEFSGGVNGVGQSLESAMNIKKSNN